MKIGDQIAYIPDHAKESGIDHPDVKLGFVYSISQYNNEKIFCRYWVKGKPGVLRTRVNSELTNLRDLILYESVSSNCISATIDEILKEKDSNEFL